MATPRKPPKGFNQIIWDNTIIVRFCQVLAYWLFFIRIVLYILINSRTFKPSAAQLLDSFTWEVVLSNTLLPVALIILSKIMKRMSEPVCSEDQRVLYAVYDLLLTGGWGQVCREAIALFILTHMFSLISTWFQYALWYLPLRIVFVFYKTTVIPMALQFLIETKIITEEHEEERYSAKPKKNKKKIKYLRTIRHWHNFKC